MAIETNKGKAEYQRSLQEASRIKAMAEAEASKIRFLAEADAERAARVGIAQAMAVEEQVRAYGGPVYQLTQSVMNRFAEAIEESRVDVVPKVIVGGNASGGQGSNVMESLLTMMLSEKMLGNVAAMQPGPQDPKVAAVRERLVKSLENGNPA